MYSCLWLHYITNDQGAEKKKIASVAHASPRRVPGNEGVWRHGTRARAHHIHQRDRQTSNGMDGYLVEKLSCIRVFGCTTSQTIAHGRRTSMLNVEHPRSMHTKVKERRGRSATRATGGAGRVGQSWAALGSVGQRWAKCAPPPARGP